MSDGKKQFDLKPIAKLTIAILSCISGVVFGADAFAAEEKRLVLRQTHRLYGPLDVELSQYYVKVHNRTTDYSFLCKAPEWDSIIYSDKRKLISKHKFSEWSKTGIRTALSIMDNQALHKWPRTLVAKKKYKGLNAAVYAFPYRYENGVPADLKHGKFGEYIVSTKLPVDNKIVMYLQALYDLPPADGIPLKLNKYAQGNSYGLGLKYNKTVSVIDVLDTTSATWDNQAIRPVSAQLQSYKAVSESAIVVKHNDISDVFQTLMDDDPKATPKKHLRGK
ncbi:MAG: hypothetical protein SGJ27_06335 [Candidatus Melainabacteria bacterium]|nr:hypothetical protein [Candidatus Melainabacteria bacterium]